MRLPGCCLTDRNKMHSLAHDPVIQFMLSTTAAANTGTLFYGIRYLIITKYHYVVACRPQGRQFRAEITHVDDKDEPLPACF